MTQPPTLTIVTSTYPYLLSVDDPPIPVAHRSGDQPRKVGPRPRFGEQLTPDVLPGEGGPQIALDQVVGAVVTTGADEYADADRVVGEGPPGPRRVEDSVTSRWSLAATPSPPVAGGSVDEANPESNSAALARWRGQRRSSVRK